MSAYVCVAYRWGDLNGHWYILYVGDDLVKARAIAAKEPDWRGGKYGAAVLEYIEKDGEGGTTLVDYFPSLYGEERPAHNYRIDAYQDLGHRAEDGVGGKSWAPDPDKPGTLKLIDVDCPQWLKDEHARVFERCGLMEWAQEERAAANAKDSNA